QFVPHHNFAHHAIGALGSNFLLDERHLLRRVGDPEPAAEPNAKVGIELGLDHRPTLGGLAYQGDCGTDPVDPVIGMVRVNIYLKVQAPRVHPRSFAVDLRAVDQRDLGASLCEIVGGSAAHQAAADDGNVGAAKYINGHSARPLPIWVSTLMPSATNV